MHKRLQTAALCLAALLGSGCLAAEPTAEPEPGPAPSSPGASWRLTAFEGNFTGGHLACVQPPLPPQCTFGPAPPSEGGEAVSTDFGGDVLAATVVLAWRATSEDATRLRLTLKGPEQAVLAQAEGTSPLEARLEGVRLDSAQLWVIVSPVPLETGVTTVYAFPEDQPYRWDMRALVEPHG